MLIAWRKSINRTTFIGHMITTELLIGWRHRALTTDSQQQWSRKESFVVRERRSEALGRFRSKI